MTEDTEGLIGRLVESATPVRRLLSPATEATALLVSLGLLGTVVIALFADTHAFMKHNQDPAEVAAFVGATLTGALAIVAAFHRARPDQPVQWALLPLPALALWMGASGMVCWTNRDESVPNMGDSWMIGESHECLLFILGLGVPLGIVLLLLLRRVRPIEPGPVSLLAALGAAALAAAMLAFFHPFDITLLDFTVHVVAMVLVIGLLWKGGLLPTHRPYRDADPNTDRGRAISPGPPVRPA